MDYCPRSLGEEDDSKHFAIPALPVNENVPVDPTREPRNGHEYLLRTRLEAARVFAEDSPESPGAPEGSRTVEGNEHILRTRLEAVAAAERTVRKVGLGRLKRKTEGDDREGEGRTKPDGRKDERRIEPDGQRDERKAKPDGQKDGRRVKEDGQSDHRAKSDGQRDDRKIKPDGQRGERKIKPDGQKDEKSPKQDVQRDERRMKPDGQRDDRRTKPDDQGGERRVKEDGHRHEKSPKQGVHERKTKQEDSRDGQPEAGRSGCSRSENEDLFLEIHDRLAKNKSRLRKKFPKKALPLEDQKLCCFLCLGSELYSRIYGEELGEFSGRPPLLSYVVHLEQEELLLLLQYFYRWYLAVGINASIARWLYAVLACLDRPIRGERAFAMLESFYLSCFKGRCQDLEYPYQCFVESMMRKLSVKDD